MNRILFHLSGGALTACFLIMGLFAYWLFWPYEIITDASPVLRLGSDRVMVGDPLVYGSSHWCKTSDLDGVVSREFVDGISYLTPLTRPHYAKGCHTTLMQIKVPETLNPGTYRLHTSVTYQVNPFREIYYEYWTPPFEVVARDPRSVFAPK